MPDLYSVGRILAIIALILGIISCGHINIPYSIIGIVLGVMARKRLRDQQDIIVKTALILNAVGISLAVLTAVFASCASLFFSSLPYSLW
jgi:uncharacterized membrane protein